MWETSSVCETTKYPSSSLLVVNGIRAEIDDVAENEDEDADACEGVVEEIVGSAKLVSLE